MYLYRNKNATEKKKSWAKETSTGGNLGKKIINVAKKVNEIAKVVKPATLVKGVLDTVAPGYKNSKYGRVLETGLNIAKSRGYDKNPHFI